MNTLLRLLFACFVATVIVFIGWAASAEAWFWDSKPDYIITENKVVYQNPGGACRVERPEHIERFYKEGKLRLLDTCIEREGQTHCHVLSDQSQLPCTGGETIFENIGELTEDDLQVGDKVKELKNLKEVHKKQDEWFPKGIQLVREEVDDMGNGILVITTTKERNKAK